MISFFVLWTGVCLWLAMMGIVLIGMTIDPVEGAGSISVTSTITLIVAGALCVGLAAVNAMMNWGMAAVATYVVLVCGILAVTACVAYRHVRGRHLWGIPTPFMGGAAAFLAAFVAFCVIVPQFSALEYEEYSYGTEIRALEVDPSISATHLAKRTDRGDYIFRYSHKSGDALGNRRYILPEEQVIFLDEGTHDVSHVEGETTAMVKIDPISGQPIEAKTGKFFRPTTLYILPSDIWGGEVAGEV